MWAQTLRFKQTHTATYDYKSSLNKKTPFKQKQGAKEIFMKKEHEKKGKKEHEKKGKS